MALELSAILSMAQRRGLIDASAPVSGTTLRELVRRSADEPAVANFLALAGVIKSDSPPEAGVATLRNLLYHVAPFKLGDSWRRNVKQVMKRIDLFNGKKIVAIATGPELVPTGDVREAFGGKVDTFLEFPNTKLEREKVSFIPMMELVESLDPGEATFYAHAKGVATIGNPEGVMYWRNLMYHALLDDLASVKNALATHAIVGTHRKNGTVVYPDGIAESPWHFSGTYFWFNHHDVFSKAWREALPPSGWGVEAWPGRMFPVEQSACLAMEEPKNSYDPALYEVKIADDDGPGGTNALKVEIGGGVFPRRDGFVNVDKLDCADVQADFELLGKGGEGSRLPFDDDTVQYIYSSHCFEHVVNLIGLLHELARVAALGCLVEIRVPHWLSNMANCHDHKQTISHIQIDHWCNSALEYWWKGCNKRLKLLETHLIPTPTLQEWKQLLPHATDDQIMRLCPDACHEYRFIMTFVPHEG